MKEKKKILLFMYKIIFSSHICVLFIKDVDLVYRMSSKLSVYLRKNRTI